MIKYIIVMSTLLCFGLELRGMDMHAAEIIPPGSQVCDLVQCIQTECADCDTNPCCECAASCIQGTFTVAIILAASCLCMPLSTTQSPIQE